MTKLDLAQQRFGDTQNFILDPVDEQASPVVAKAHTQNGAASVRIAADNKAVLSLHYHSTTRDNAQLIRSASEAIMALSDPNMDAQNLATLKEDIDSDAFREEKRDHFLFRGYSFAIYRNDTGVVIEGKRIE